MWGVPGACRERRTKHLGEPCSPLAARTPHADGSHRRPGLNPNGTALARGDIAPCAAAATAAATAERRLDRLVLRPSAQAGVREA